MSLVRQRNVLSGPRRKARKKPNKMSPEKSIIEHDAPTPSSSQLSERAWRSITHWRFDGS